MQKTKLIATKKLVLTLIILSLGLIALGSYPHFKWSSFEIPIYIWAVLVIADVLGLVFLAVYQLGAKQANDKAQKYNSLRHKYNDMKESNDKNRRRAAETDRIEAEKKSLEAEKATLERKLRFEADYITEYKKIYTDIPTASTRRYALECFCYYNGLDLFEPITYRQNSRYATIIDQNADRLYDILTAPVEGLYNDNTHLVRAELKKLLGGGNGGGSGNAPVLTRERQTLKKIDKGEER